jgi:hypothetical protein
MSNTRLYIAAAAFVLGSACTDAFAQVNIGVSTPSINLGKGKRSKNKEDDEKKEKEEKTTNTKNENPSGTTRPSTTTTVQEKKPEQPAKKSVLDKYTPEQINAILNKASYPDYEKDRNVLWEFSKLYIVRQNGTNFYGTLSYNTLEATRQANMFKSSSEAITPIGEKYAEYWEVYEAVNKKKEDMHTLYLEDKKAIAEFAKNVSNYHNLPAQAQKHLDEALANSNQFKAANTTENKYGEDEYASKVGWKFDNANYCLALLRCQKGDNDPEVIQLASNIETTKKACEKTRDDIYAVKLAAVKCPVDAYKGADRDKLKNMVKTHWKTLYPGETILGVYILDQNWERRKGSEYNKLTNRNENYDNSWLLVHIVVQKSPEVADIYGAYIQKNHMKNNEVDCDNFNKALGIRKGEILVKNVK